MRRVVSSSPPSLHGNPLRGLVEDAPAVLRRVCDFVELPYDGRMERYYESADERLGRSIPCIAATARCSLPKRSGSTINASPRNRRSGRASPAGVTNGRETQAGFADTAGDLLEELGYSNG